jgi:integrase
MTIRQRGNMWQVDHPASLAGRRIRESFASRKEAEDRERQVRRNPALLASKAEEVNHKRAKAMTFGRLLDLLWKNHYSLSKAKATARNTSEALREYFGHDTPLSDIGREMIDGYVARELNRGLKGSSITRRLTVLRYALRYAHECGYIQRLPRIKKIGQTESRIGFLTREQVQQIVDTLVSWEKMDYALFVLVLAYTGMRPGEALRLTVADVTEEYLSVHGTKTGKARTIPIAQEIRSVINHLVANAQGGKLFTFRYEQFARYWELVREHLGKVDDPMWVPYILRHSFGSWLVQKGADLRSIADLMGHATINQTMKYAKVAPANLRSAIDLL